MGQIAAATAAADAAAAAVTVATDAAAAAAASACAAAVAIGTAAGARDNAAAGVGVCTFGSAKPAPSEHLLATWYRAEALVQKLHHRRLQPLAIRARAMQLCALATSESCHEPLQLQSA